ILKVLWPACGPHPIYPETSSLPCIARVPIGGCWVIRLDHKMAFEPSCGELNDSLKCAGLREEMGCARHYFDTLFSSETFQGPLVEFDHAGIRTSHNQKRRRLDLGQHAAGKIGAPTARNHSADAVTEQARRAKRGSRACARSEQS